MVVSTLHLVQPVLNPSSHLDNYSADRLEHLLRVELDLVSKGSIKHMAKFTFLIALAYFNSDCIFRQAVSPSVLFLRKTLSCSAQLIFLFQLQDESRNGVSIRKGYISFFKTVTSKNRYMSTTNGFPVKLERKKRRWVGSVGGASESAGAEKTKNFSICWRREEGDRGDDLEGFAGGEVAGGGATTVSAAAGGRRG